LSDEIRGHLSVVVDLVDEDNVPLIEMTTSSKEAYRLYIKGIEKLNATLFQESEELLLEAVNIDSTFSRPC